MQAFSSIKKQKPTPWINVKRYFSKSDTPLHTNRGSLEITPCLRLRKDFLGQGVVLMVE